MSTWKEFRKLVNRHVSRITGGLGILDMSDVCFYDYFPEDGDVNPVMIDQLALEAAEYVLEMNGFPLD